MAKKVTTISIDEDVLKKAKRELPNFSLFIEDCLKAFLGIGNLELMTIDENREIIKNAMLKIQVLSVKNDTEVFEEHFNIKQQNDAWIKLFGAYRKHQDVQNDYVEVGRILNVDSTQLHESLELIDYECSKEDLVKCNDWNYVKKRFLK